MQAWAQRSVMQLLRAQLPARGLQRGQQLKPTHSDRAYRSPTHLQPQRARQARQPPATHLQLATWFAWQRAVRLQ